MPLYDYFCSSNNQTVEVMHGINDLVETWGELCRLAKCHPGLTLEDAPVNRLIRAPGVIVPTGDSDYKSMGFKKLVKRDKGVYENATAKGNEKRIVEA